MMTRTRARMTAWRSIGWAATLLLAATAQAGAQVVDVSAIWPKGEGLKKASDPKIEHFRITGPGRLEVHLSLDPYRHAGRNAYVPVVWRRVTGPGKTTGWTVLGEVVSGRGYPDTFFQGGKEARNWAEGVPWEMVSTFDVAAGTYDLDVQLAAPAVMYSAGVTQWSQKAHLVVTFSPGNPSGTASKAPTTTPSTVPSATPSNAQPTPPPPPAGSALTGTWTMQAGGYGNTLEISGRAGAYTVRWLNPGVAAETMRDVTFDPATGALSFTRPMKAKGYPDQIFKGKLDGNKMSGEFGFEHLTGAKTGWTAVRKS